MMKKRIISLLLSLLLLLLLPTALLIAELALPRIYGDTYYAELPKMVNRLKQADGNRLILIGGSSVAFGTDTRLLEDILEQHGFSYTVCPMGLYAAVGTSAMLDLTAPELRQGDLVVLTFEPTSETMSEYFGASAYWKCAESDPSLLLLADSSKRAALVGSYPGFLQERWGIRNSGEYPSVNDVYALSSFDAQCNLVYPRAGNTMLLGYDISQPIDLDAVTIQDDFAQHVRTFCQKADTVGARVMLSFSPMNRSAMADTSEQTYLDYFTLCCKTFGCTPISDPRNYVLDSGWFYDSNFHLNSAGAQLRTQLLAADLLAELGCYQSLDLEQPVMPEPVAQTVRDSAGDNAFLFSPTDDGMAYQVSGLNDYGRTAQELTVPAVWDALPVIGFTEDALTDADALAELRLPDTIQFLPDCLFSHCPKLTRLILEHTDAPCTISEHSFDGAEQLRIYVPKDAYHLYRDGVGCEQNPWLPYLNRIYTY